MRTLQLARFIFCLVVVMTSCGGEATKGVPAETFLPTSEDYWQVEAETVGSALAKIDVLAALVTGDPILSTKVQVIEGYLTCMRKTGSVAMRFYSHKEYPEAAGTVLVINADRALSIANLLGCVNDTAQRLMGNNVELKPCSDVWEYKQEATYFFLYAGTSPMICDFFAATLPRGS